MSLKYQQALLVLFGVANYQPGVVAVQSGSFVQQKLGSEMASTQKIQLESNQKLDSMSFVESSQSMAQKMQSSTKSTVESKQKLVSANKAQVEQQNTNQMESEAKWGFLKNIVNIDSFFSSGKESTSSTDSKSDSKKSSFVSSSKQAKSVKASQHKRKTTSSDPQLQKDKSKTIEQQLTNKVANNNADQGKKQEETTITPEQNAVINDYKTDAKDDQKHILVKKNIQQDLKDLMKKEKETNINNNNSVSQQAQKKAEIKKPVEIKKNLSKKIKVDKKKNVNSTKKSVKNLTHTKNVTKVVKPILNQIKVVKKKPFFELPVYELNQMDSNKSENSDKKETESKKSSTSIAQTSSDSSRQRSDSEQDVSPEAQKSMQETNSEQSVTEWMRPASVNENPRDDEGKVVDGDENVVQQPQEKQESPDEFVKKEVDDGEISDEDHPPIVVRKSNQKPQIKGKTNEDHSPLQIRDSHPKQKTKNYFRSSQKGGKKVEPAPKEDHQSAEKLEKALEKVNKRSAQVEDALKKFETASFMADKLKTENTLESVDAHKKLYESKRRAVRAVEAKKRAQTKLNKVLKKTEDRKSQRSSASSNSKELTPIREVSDSDDSSESMRVPAQRHLADMSLKKMPVKKATSKSQKLLQSNSTEEEKVDKKDENTNDQQEENKNEEGQGEKETYSMFTLEKNEGRLTLRNMKFLAGNQQELDEEIGKHKDRSIIAVKDNQIVNTNCFKESSGDSVDYQRLVGFATIEGALQPEKLAKFNEQPDQRYLTWVEGSANMKDIVWKSIHGLNSQKKVNQLFQKHQGNGNGPVIIKISDKDQSLHILKHNQDQHMPKQALGLGHFITQKLKLYDAAPSQKSSDE